MSHRTLLLPFALLLAACTITVHESRKPDPGPTRPVEGAHTSREPLLAPVRAPDLSAYQEVVNRIVGNALAEGRTYEALAELVEVAPLRLSGSPGAERAVQWALEEMLEAGLENVRLEPVMVPLWVRGEVEELDVLHADGGEESLDVLALGGSIATPLEGLEAGVIEVRDFEELAARAGEARGKIVFFNRPLDPASVNTFRAYGGAVDQRSRGAIEAARVGGVAAVVRSMSTRIDDFPHTGAMLYEEGLEQVPSAAVSTLDAERLSELIREDAGLRLRLRLDCSSGDDVLSHNVVGELVGRTRPEEVLVVGGHLDAWDVGQGASDDGGGCCQSIEVVRLLKRLDLRPQRTIRVVLFMNEENGLRGGIQYHLDHADEMANHVLALESDAGPFTPRGFRTDAGPAARAVIEEVSRLLRFAGVTEVSTGTGGADISPLVASGVITCGFVPDSQRYFDLHHSDADTLDQISHRELNLGAGVMTALLYVLADLEQRLPANEPAAGR